MEGDPAHAVAERWQPLVTCIVHRKDCRVQIEGLVFETHQQDNVEEKHNGHVVEAVLLRPVEA